MDDAVQSAIGGIKYRQIYHHLIRGIKYKKSTIRNQSLFQKSIFASKDTQRG
jgi:hypothetical protein